MKWKTIKLADFASGSVHRGPHAMNKKILHWVYCSGCGLVGLNNDVSRRAMLSQCVWEE